MLNDWLYVGIFALVSMFLPAAAISIAALLSPKKPNSVKNATYECGMETVGPAWAQIKVQNYVCALIFLVFDVESVLLFPWAVAYNKLPLYGVV